MLDALSISFALGVLSGVVRAARAIDAGGTFKLPGGFVVLDVAAGTGYGTLAAWFLVMGSASAIMVGLTDRLAQSLSAHYQHDVVMRSLARLSSPEPARWAVGADRPPEALARFCTTGAPVILNRWCQMMLQSIRPTLLMAGAAVALPILDFGLTLKLLPLLPLYLVWLVRLSLRARESDAAWRRARADFRDGLGRWRPHAHAELAEIEGLHAEVSRHLRERRLVVSRSRAGNGLFFAVTLAVVFASSASRYGSGGESWAGLILYVLALRFLVNGLRTSTASLMRIQIQARVVEPFLRLIGAVPQTPVPSLGPAARFFREPSPTVVVTVPWRPGALDLALVEALVGPALTAAGAGAPVRMGADAPAAPATQGEGGGAPWRIALAREWPDLGGREACGAAGGVILVEALDVPPDRLERRAEGRPTGVLVWGGSAWLGSGDGDWYAENWKALREAQARDAAADSLAEEVAFDDDASSNE